MSPATRAPRVPGTRGRVLGGEGGEGAAAPGHPLHPATPSPFPEGFCTRRTAGRFTRGGEGRIKGSRAERGCSGAASAAAAAAGRSQRGGAGVRGARGAATGGARGATRESGWALPAGERAPRSVGRNFQVSVREPARGFPPPRGAA